MTVDDELRGALASYLDGLTAPSGTLGWTAQRAALAAFGSGRVAGDASALAAALAGSASSALRTDDQEGAVADAVAAVLARGERVLLMAPPARLPGLLEALDTSGSFVLHLAEDPPSTGPAPVLRRGGGTVEFAAPSAPSTATRQDTRVVAALPDERREPTTEFGRPSTGTLPLRPVTPDDLPSPSEATQALPPVPDPHATQATDATPHSPTHGDSATPSGGSRAAWAGNATQSGPTPADNATPPGASRAAWGEDATQNGLPSGEPRAAQDADAARDGWARGEEAAPSGPPRDDDATPFGRPRAARDEEATPFGEPRADASPSEETRALPPVPDAELVVDASSLSEETQALQPIADEEIAPEMLVRGVLIRPVGTKWRTAWQDEEKELRRGLLWLEQWPRDVATLRALEEDQESRRRAADAEIAALTARIEELTEAAERAAEAVPPAEEEAERRTADRDAAAEEAAGPRAEADRLRAEADTAADEARERTRVADLAYGRCVAIDERTAQAHAETQAARQQEERLTVDLARARSELPQIAAEADRLGAEDADAVAEGHASYYRLVSAESALSAARQRMTLTQKLHVAAPPPELKRLRDEVRARTREADEAARRANEIKAAAERTRTHRERLEQFLVEGGEALAGAKNAQERLAEEIARLGAERETAVAEHRAQARSAGEAVDRATQAGTAARHAEQEALLLEEKAAAAARIADAAADAADRARGEAQAANERVTSAREELNRLHAAVAERVALDEAELTGARETEERSRERVRELCGDNPDAAELAAHQARVMRRIETLARLLGGVGDHAPLLTEADVVCGSPVALGAVPLPDADTLVVAGAGEITDAEFLVGAVRARRWVLVGTDGERPAVRSGHERPARGLLEDASVVVVPEDEVQRPADDPDDDGAPERGPEPVDVEGQVEPFGELAGEQHEQAVDDEPEQAERQDVERAAEGLDDRLDDRVDEAEDDRDPDEREGLAAGVVAADGDAVDEHGGDPQRDRRDSDLQ